MQWVVRDDVLNFDASQGFLPPYSRRQFGADEYKMVVDAEHVPGELSEMNCVFVCVCVCACMRVCVIYLVTEKKTYFVIFACRATA